MPETKSQPQFRLQTINDDTVLEITETIVQKRTLSENALLRQREYYTTQIAEAQTSLENVNQLLAQIENEREKSK